MAWIEQKNDRHRVLWRENGIRQWEWFTTTDEAEMFRRQVESFGNRWPFGWIKGRGYIQPEHVDSPRFRDYAAKAIAARPKADQNTKNGYTAMLRDHINPVLGDLPLTAITRFDVVSVADRMHLLGRSQKTIANVHSCLSSILNDAVLRDRLIPFNPAVGSLPEYDEEPAGDGLVLLPEEFTRLQSFMPGEERRDLADLLYSIGPRFGEATALQVGDIDPRRKIMKIRRAWKNRGATLGPPKTKVGNRDAALTDRLLAMLEPHMHGKAPTDLLFTLPRGGRVTHSNFYQFGWTPAVFAARCCDEHREQLVADWKAWRSYEAHRGKDDPHREKPLPCGHAGALLKQPRIHDLRHSRITLLLHAGVHPIDVGREVGQKTLATTVGVYGHTLGTLDTIRTVADAHAA